jgi:hypothetical protein
MADANKGNVGVLEGQEAPVQPETGSERRSGATRRPRRAAERAGSASGRVRFFLLGKESGREDSKVVLGEECESEDKALVASLVQGVPFLRIETWIASAQKQGKSMVIEKRAT